MRSNLNNNKGALSQKCVLPFSFQALQFVHRSSFNSVLQYLYFRHVSQLGPLLSCHSWTWSHCLQSRISRLDEHARTILSVHVNEIIGNGHSERYPGPPQMISSQGESLWEVYMTTFTLHEVGVDREVVISAYLPNVLGTKQGLATHN